MPPRRDTTQSKKPRKPLPEELARDANRARGKGPGWQGADDVSRGTQQTAGGSLGSLAIREEKDIGTLVTEILEAAAVKGKA